MEFGRMIKLMRAVKEISLRDFCVAAQVDPSYWSKVERGIIPPPAEREHIAKIAGVFLPHKWMVDDLEAVAKASTIKPMTKHQFVTGQMPAIPPREFDFAKFAELQGAEYDALADANFGWVALDPKYLQAPPAVTGQEKE